MLIIEPARAALDFYRKLNDAAKDERLRRKSVVENGENLDDGDDDSTMVKSNSGLSVSRRSVGNASIQVCVCYYSQVIVVFTGIFDL